MHKVLVNRLGGLSLPRKSVVRLTDRPDLTLDVYRGRKTTMQQQQQPSVCPSVNFSCPLRNCNTIQGIFMKLGTNVNHHQMMCKEQEPKLHLHFMENHVRSITLEYFHETWYKYKPPSDNVQRKRTNSTHIFYRIKPL